jgi:hypothetical protein
MNVVATIAASAAAPSPTTESLAAIQAEVRALWTQQQATPTPTSGKPLCRHCLTWRVNRPRGLCWTCWHTPGVCALYPSTSKFSRCGVGQGNFTGKLPEPTDAWPGTEAKVRVLCERAARGEQLHHPHDTKITMTTGVKRGFCRMLADAG